MGLIRKVSSLTVGVAAALCLTAVPAAAENWWESKQESTPTDRIEVEHSKEHPDRVTTATRTNWEDGYIEVKAGATADTRDTVNLAHAYSVALKTARHLAYEKLAETVGGINLYADATYDRELMRDANLRTLVRAMVRGARVVDETKNQFSDGSVWAEVTLGMKLYGEDGLVKPSTEWKARRQPEPAPAEKPAPVEPEPVAPQGTSPSTEPYTGLVIDARGMGGSPAMLPKIVSAGGQVIYGTGEVDKDYVVRMGIMGYQASLDQARTSDRVGANPLVVQASGVAGKNRADFVVSDEDARRILDAAASNDFLKECRVVAVLK